MTAPDAPSIAEVRRQAGLSQRDLAERIGAQLWTVEQIERGRQDPGPYLGAIAVATGQAGDWILAHRREASDEPDATSGASPGAALAATRRRRGLTQAELARRLDVPLWVVDRFERDLEPLDEEGRSAIADAIGIDEPRLEVPEAASERHAAGPAPEARRGWRDDGVRNIILASAATLVTIRFFAEDLGVIPRSAKLVDIPILMVLLLVAALAPEVRRRDDDDGSRYLLPAVLFLGVCVVSVVVNSGRIEPAPALLFMYGFLAPVVIFQVVRQLWPVGQALAFSRVLVALACMQFAVVLFIDLPEYIATNDPDLVSGTFGENAYQLVFFLLMCAALVAGIATVERGRLVGRLAPLFFTATIATILLAQYRALLLTTALTVLLVATLLGLVRVRGALAGVLAGVAFVACVSYIPSIFPQLKFQETISTLTGSPGSYAAKRLEVGRDVVSLYTDKPGAIVIGTGPGTYSSRAWETFAESPTKSSSALGVKLPGVSSEGYRTDVADKYTIPRLQQQETIEGSFALTQPLSSYYALMAEVGLLGFVALLAIYGRALVESVRMTLTALRRAPPGDPLPGLLLASTAGFFVILQMAILENWLEVTRLTFILWALFAVGVTEFQARYGGSPTRKEAVA